jgi:predicted kinase
MYFIQMSGFPGSGKSTLARRIAEKTGAVIIDHDIIKSSLLNSIDNTPIDAKSAGRISYNIDWSLAESLLYQGKAVIFDSPCLYKEMVEKGTGLAKKFNVKYKYVECYLEDSIEINRRLRNRDRMVSQIKEIYSEEAFRYALKNSEKPADYKCLLIDTSQPVERYLPAVINYLKE